MLETWLKSYKPEDIFDGDGAVVESITSLAPSGDLRMDILTFIVIKDLNQSCEILADRQARQRGVTLHVSVLASVVGSHAGGGRARVGARVGVRVGRDADETRAREDMVRLTAHTFI